MLGRQQYLARKNPEIAGTDFLNYSRWTQIKGVKASLFDVYFDTPPEYVQGVLKDNSIDVSIAACYCASMPLPAKESVSEEYKELYCVMHSLPDIVPSTRFHLSKATLEKYLGDYSIFNPLFERLGNGIENVYLIAFYVLKDREFFEKARLINPNLDYSLADRLLLLERKIESKTGFL